MTQNFYPESTPEILIWRDRTVRITLTDSQLKLLLSWANSSTRAAVTIEGLLVPTHLEGTESASGVAEMQRREMGKKFGITETCSD